MRCPFTFIAFGLFLMLSAGAEIKSAEHPHPFTVHDLLAMDRIDDPRVSPDGKTLAYLAVARPGYEADKFRIVLKAWPDGPERILTEAWDRFVCGMDHLKSPVELYSVRLDGKKLRQLTDINAGKLAAARLGEPEQFTFRGGDRDRGG